MKLEVDCLACLSRGSHDIVTSINGVTHYVRLDGLYVPHKVCDYDERWFIWTSVPREAVPTETCVPLNEHGQRSMDLATGKRSPWDA